MPSLVFFFLAMVCEQLPSPLQMSNERVEKLLASRAHPFDTLPPATQQLKNGTNFGFSCLKKISCLLGACDIFVPCF
jgi:hypothetical protein